MNPYKATEDFEKALAEYTGAPYVVAVSSCTAAIHLCCLFHKVDNVILPKHTYVGVAQSVVNAGGTITFFDIDWEGSYRLSPYPIIDSARFISRGMYRADLDKGLDICLSFHASKPLGIEMGGAILTDDEDRADWYRAARFDGRVDAGHDYYIRGYHYIMPPSIAAQGLLKLYTLPDKIPPLPNDAYPDLSQYEVFR